VRHAHRHPNPVSQSRPQRETQRPAISQAKLAGNRNASNTTAATAFQNRGFAGARLRLGGRAPRKPVSMPLFRKCRLTAHFSRSEVTRSEHHTVEQSWADRLEGSHRQSHDEWVLLIAGLAGRIEGDDERKLPPGDHVLMPAQRAHWVTYMAIGPTIWLAIHFT
jgi:hypothetical protein